MPQANYVPMKPSFSFIQSPAGTGLLQTKTKCWWGDQCTDPSAANSAAACNERCNCEYTGNVTMGNMGCVERTEEAALAIFQEHCTNVNTMGPCEEASGTESTYSQLIEGKYPTLT